MLYNIPVHLLRQWCYCPRIVYYLELTHFSVSYPLWVKQGEFFHREQARLWQRRNLSRFNLDKGKIHLDLAGSSSKYGIHGVADMLIETEKEVFPVEFKLAASRIKRGALFQLTGYGMIMEEVFEKSCTHAFLAEGDKILHKINITVLKKDIITTSQLIRKMIEKGMKPDSSATLVQCTNCEYLNYCNDRG